MLPFARRWEFSNLSIISNERCKSGHAPCWPALMLVKVLAYATRTHVLSHSLCARFVSGCIHARGIQRVCGHESPKKWQVKYENNNTVTLFRRLIVLCHQILIPRKTHEESVDCRNTISNWASEVTRHYVGFVPFRSVIRFKSRSSLLNNQIKKTLTKRDIFSRIFYTRKNRSHAFTLIFFFLRVRQRAVLISRLSHLHKLAKIALELWKREACAPCPRCLRCTIYFRWLAPWTE